MKITTFEQLQLSHDTQKALSDMGFSAPSEIQASTIPLLLDGHDVLGQAQTGTGKTAAFGIPIVETISTKSRFVEALIMCPTRELAVQVCEELKRIAKYRPQFNFATIYGGESIQKQFTALKKGAQIVVGTPGRILDHMRRKSLDLSKVKMIVLDEADEMLNMGFRDDMELILQEIPHERQTVLFSATMPKPILELTKQYQTNPQIVKVEKNQMTVSAIEQVYFETSNAKKIELMARLIDIYDLKLGLIFCNTKRMVDEIVKKLQDLHYKAEAIHGDLKQAQRNAVLAKFRSSQINFLVATDVAARGIDVKDVDVVFNYDLPLDVEYYVHRIGRTGRAGKSGRAYSFITGRNELRRLQAIEKATKGKIVLHKAPTEENRRAQKWNKFYTSIKEKAENVDVFAYEDVMGQLEQQGLSLKEICAVLLEQSIGKTLMKMNDKPIVNNLDEAVKESAHRGSDKEKRSSRSDFGRFERKDFSKGYSKEGRRSSKSGPKGGDFQREKKHFSDRKSPLGKSKVSSEKSSKNHKKR